MDNAIQHYKDKTYKEADIRLRQTATNARISMKSWKPAIKYGDAAQIIIMQEKEQHADLVIIGKHDHGVVDEFLLGSYTRKILTHSQCDVLIANC